jgi:hypothetical protein
LAASAGVVGLEGGDEVGVVLAQLVLPDLDHLLVERNRPLVLALLGVQFRQLQKILGAQ